MELTHTTLINCPAPAKLNLHLRITGKRHDGYHTLQTIFRLIDLADYLDFTLRKDEQIILKSSCASIDSSENLCVKAALLLRQATGTRQGIDIYLHKNLPIGAGIGGGSSDAASTLIALNYLWQLNLSRQQLSQLGLTLGADIPFFLFGQDAFAQGIGEQLQPIDLPASHYLLLFPAISISTTEIFSSRLLTKYSKPIIITDFVDKNTYNDLQQVACQLYPEVNEAINWLNKQVNRPVCMTGSGSCVFTQVEDKVFATQIIRQCPKHWNIWYTGSISKHPLDELMQ